MSDTDDRIAPRALRVRIETHGCKLNAADSQVLARRFSLEGFEIAPPSAQADVYVLNSCTVTHVADRKARQALARARRELPHALIVAAGCLAERAAAELASSPMVDLTITNRQKSTLVEQVSALLGEKKETGRAARPGISGHLLGRSRAAIKIQEGCDQVCAYCIVPKVRGRERSIPAASLVRQVAELANAGCLEVVLTGTQLGSYGFDLMDECLTSLVRRLLRETAIPRLRISSLQPAEITDELLELWTGIGSGRLCPHFHVPLQSGSDRILARMRRRYDSAGYHMALKRIRSAVPDASVTADVIAGFPGETADDHAATLEAIAAASLADAHVFPFSARPGTSAAHFPGQAPYPVRRARAAEIRRLAAVSSLAFRTSMLGLSRQVLWEGPALETGLTDNYLRVRRPSGERPAAGRADWGLLEDVTLTALDGSVLIGETEQMPTLEPAAAG